MTTTYTYDDNGNLQVTDVAGTKVTNTWDDENRLTKADFNTGTDSQFTFNGDGQRVKTIDSSGTLKQIWDLENILLETNNSNTTQVANTHDVIETIHVVVSVSPVQGKRGRPKMRPESLVADKAYDDGALRALLRWLGVRPLIPRRGEPAKGLGRQRWPVERTISWLHQFRRLRVRWERKAEYHDALLTIAASIICYRMLN